MTDLWAAFLAARLDEDEAVAKAAADGGGWSARGPYDGDPGACFVVREDGHDVAAWITSEDAAHIARYDPARALGEVAAKRAILAMHTEAQAWSYPPGDGDEAVQDALETVIRHLAGDWPGHPDYPGRDPQTPK